jgi:hypothetical protein
MLAVAQGSIDDDGSSSGAGSTLIADLTNKPHLTTGILFFTSSRCRSRAELVNPAVMMFM